MKKREENKRNKTWLPSHDDCFFLVHVLQHDASFWFGLDNARWTRGGDMLLTSRESCSVPKSIIMILSQYAKSSRRPLIKAAYVGLLTPRKGRRHRNPGFSEEGVVASLFNHGMLDVGRPKTRQTCFDYPSLNLAGSLSRSR